MWLLRQAQLALNLRIAEETDLGGPTIPQWVPLYKVHLGQADTVADLARKCTVDAGAMTRLLDRLESRGLCRRVRSQTDRRVVHIQLTPEGVAAAEKVPQALMRVYADALCDFSDEERQQLQSFLRRIAANAEQASRAHSSKT